MRHLAENLIPLSLENMPNEFQLLFSTEKPKAYGVLREILRAAPREASIVKADRSAARNAFSSGTQRYNASGQFHEA
jgi:hypothetical protein